MQNLINKIKELPLPVKSTIICVLCSVLQKGIAFIVVPIYTRMVPSNQYGVYSLYQSWESVLSVFATLNLWTYCFSRGMLRYEKDKDRFVSALVGLSFVLTLIVFVVLYIFSNCFLGFSHLSVTILAIMMVEFILRPSYEFWCAKQRFEFNVKKYAITAIIIFTFTPVVSIMLIKYFNTCYSALGTLLVVGKNFVPFIIYTCVLIGILSKRKALYDKDVWKYALGFNLPLLPHFLSVVILAQSDRIMIGSMCGTKEAAIYSVAYSVASVMLILNTAIMDSIIPWTFKKMKSGDLKSIPTVSVISLCIIVAINLMVSMFAPEVIRIMAPEEYYEAIYIIPPVAMSNVFIFMFNLFANIEYYYEKTKLVAIASCLSAGLNLLLNYIFINAYGFVAAGYTTLACYIAYAMCHYAFMKYVLKKNSAYNMIYNEWAIWIIGIVAISLAISIIFLYKMLLPRVIFLLLIIMLVIIFGERIINTIKSVKGREN